MSNRSRMFAAGAPFRQPNPNLRLEKHEATANHRMGRRVAVMARDWASSWRMVFTGQSALSDVMAGITVAAVALPLNIALAIACGVPPVAGLVAGVVGGFIASFAGGAPLQVTGPSAALTILLVGVFADFGAAGVAASALLSGICIAIFAFTGWAKHLKHLPQVVLAGVTTGVGLKLLDGQIPVLLGFDYAVSELATMIHRPVWLHEVSWVSVVCGLLVAVVVLLTQRFKQFPGALVGLALATFISVYVAWELKRVGALPNTLPLPQVPNVPAEGWASLLMSALPIALLTAIETLVSAQVIDRMINAKKGFNGNLESLGVGLANIGAGLMGGMPVSGVIVRSSVNLQSGGKTRAAGMVHALVLLGTMLFLTTFMAQVPLAGLAGLICVVALRLVDVQTLRQALSQDKLAAVAFLITAIGTVTGNLLAGLALGFSIAFSPKIPKLVRELFADKQRSVHTPTESRFDEHKPRRSAHPFSINSLPDAKHQRAHIEKSQPAAKTVSLLDRNSWLEKIRQHAQVAASAFVHGHASVIGKVVLGENVHIAAGSSVRADEGTPFFIGANSNIQDGVVIHALKDRYVQVDGEAWAVYVGERVSLAHQALLHGPSYVGSDCFIGFRAVVHDSVVGDHCYIGIGAIVVGVNIAAERHVPAGALIDTQEKADVLANVNPAHTHFNEDVVEVNRGLAAAYKASSLRHAEVALVPPQNHRDERRNSWN